MTPLASNRRVRGGGRPISSNASTAGRLSKRKGAPTTRNALFSLGWVLAKAVLLATPIVALLTISFALSSLSSSGGAPNGDDRLLFTSTNPVAASGDVGGDDGGQVDNPLKLRLDRSLRVRLPAVSPPAASQPKKVALLHIGKTAGSTVASQLPNGCPEWIRLKYDPPRCPGRAPPLPPPNNATSSSTSGGGAISHLVDDTAETQSHMSRLVESYYHLATLPLDNDFTSVVVTARNPYDRAVSAFLYDHPDNIKARKYRDAEIRRIAEERGEESSHYDEHFYPPKRQTFVYACFPSLEDFASAADGRPIKEKGGMGFARGPGLRREVLRVNCAKCAADALRGTEEHMGHLYWNYRRYLSNVTDAKEIFVLRKEHLDEDWAEANRILGGEQNGEGGAGAAAAVALPSGESGRMREERSVYPVQGNVTARGRWVLCHHLEDEMRAYARLLNRAVNLKDEDVLESLRELTISCPNVIIEDT